MSEKDDLYKRKDDHSWRQSVDDRLVSLTSAQKSTDADLEDQEDRLGTLEHLIAGTKGDRDDTGLKGDVKDLWKAYNELRAIIAPDHLGHGGIRNRLEAIEGELGIKKTYSARGWKFATAVGLAVVSTTAFIISNWDSVEKIGTKIGKAFHSQSSKAITKAARANAPRKRIVKVRVVPAPPQSIVPKEDVDNGATKEDVPK